MFRRRSTKRVGRYVVITDFRTVTRKQCVDADTHNAKVMAEISALRGSFGVSMRERFPLPPSNAAAFDAWEVSNTPVPADMQALAVEHLTETGMDNYAPEIAWEVAQADRRHKKLAPLVTRQEAVHESDYYTVYVDVSARTMEECIRADIANTKRWQRTLKDMVKMQQRFPTDYVPTDSANPPVSNVLHKTRELRRSVLVPAAEQKRAVQTLFRAGMRVYLDYEPQEAITKAASCPAAPPYYTGPYGNTDFIVPIPPTPKTLYPTINEEEELTPPP